MIKKVKQLNKCYPASKFTVFNKKIKFSNICGKGILSNKQIQLLTEAQQEDYFFARQVKFFLKKRFFPFFDDFFEKNCIFIRQILAFIKYKCKGHKLSKNIYYIIAAEYYTASSYNIDKIDTKFKLKLSKHKLTSYIGY